VEADGWGVIEEVTSADEIGRGKELHDGGNEVASDVGKESSEDARA
jgi:hypothetical protein